MNASLDTPSTGSRARVVIIYAVNSMLLTVLAGFIVGVARRLFPQVIPVHVAGALDIGGILNLVISAVVALLVYRHLAVRHSRLYWKAAVPIAILSATGNLLCFSLLSPETAKHYLVRLFLLTIAFELAMAFIASFFRWKSVVGTEPPNKSVERTRAR